MLTKNRLQEKCTFLIYRFCSWKKSSISSLTPSSLPFFLPTSRHCPRLPSLQRCWCPCFPSISPSSPLPLLPLSISNTFLATAGRWIWSGCPHAGASSDPDMMLGILHTLQGQGEPRCPAGCRICPSRRAIVRNHPCACYGIDPCSMLKSGHGKDREKHKPVHANLAVMMLPLQGAANLQCPLSHCTTNQAGPALEHSQSEKLKEGGR